MIEKALKATLLASTLVILAGCQLENCSSSGIYETRVFEQTLRCSKSCTWVTYTNDLVFCKDGSGYWQNMGAVYSNDEDYNKAHPEGIRRIKIIQAKD